MEYTLYNNDCIAQMKEMEDNSIDSIITDPPYEISFMSKGWDGTGIAFNTEVWEECMRVLKPGGHILAFGATRTYHRMAVAIEDSGFEIRDCIFWCYGQGFPKSHNIGKSVDKIQGNERKVVGVSKNDRPNSQVKGGRGFDSAFNNGQEHQTIMETKGNSPYEGWGTALKPAVEPVVMGRKPFKVSVAQNVMEWGTGGINIDGCRINTITETDKNNWTSIRNKQPDNTGWGFRGDSGGPELNTQGRFPANLILDEEAGKILDTQSGKLNKQAKCKTDNKSGWQNEYVGGDKVNVVERKLYLDEGGASRFFYCPKVSKKERNEGCKELSDKEINVNRANNMVCTICGKQSFSGNPCKCENPNWEVKDLQTTSKNHHPTIKPVNLLQYLIRLITPKGGVVLDPFMGSGSTGKACMKEGMDFIGIEKEEEYYKIAEARIQYEQNRNNHHKFMDI